MNKRPLEKYVGLSLLWGTFGFPRVRNSPRSKNEKKSKIKGENDRMRANDICFLHYMTRYTCLRVALVAF